MEAMAAGKAVVATAVGGTPELIDSGVTGFLVPPKDAGELESALSRVIEDPDLRKKVGEAARSRSKSFDIRNVAAGYHALYETLLARRKGR